MPTAVDLRRGLALAAAVLYAVLASLTRPLTGSAAAAVAVPAAIVLTRACRRRAPGSAGAVSARIRRTAVAWGVVVLLAGALEVAALSGQPAYDVASPDHPTLSFLMDQVTEGWPLRFVAWCCWLYVGWVVARR